MERRDVVICGAGPAGTATALHLVRRDPALAGRILVLDKARHPRPKVCAGGLIPHALACLDELEVGLRVPHVMVDRARVEVPRRRVEVEGRGFCAIVRRAEFDASLVAAVRARGVEVREDEKVHTLRRDGEGVRVVTARGELGARLVVGADGSGSLVRRRLLAGADDDRRSLGRAVMTDVPLAGASAWDGHARARYDFDFRAVPAGLAGYAWAFPCLIGGRPHANVGVYARRAGAGPALVPLLDAVLAELGAARVRHEAAPIRCWARTPFVAPHVLLVGDAAGAEPLMGEGISFAFEYGRWAADEIARALAAGDLALAGAERRFRRSWAGRKLDRLAQAATMFYGPGARLWLGLAAEWRGAQAVGLRWYNGVDGWDRRSGWQALWSALRGTAVARAPLEVQ
jgi:geranylgeranyl reductase family protein